jgi:hypothetical protein
MLGGVQVSGVLFLAGAALFGCAGIAATVAIFRTGPDSRASAWFYLLTAGGAACYLTGDLLERDWSESGWDALLLAGIIWVWWHWWRRRRRRRAAVVSEQGRRVRAVLVRTMRERRRPRQVFRPGRVPA